MFKKKICCFGITFIGITLCCSSTTLAQEKEAEKEAQTEEAEQSTAATPVRSMEAISVTATRQQRKALDVPSTVNIISREEMDRHNTSNIQELIRYQPGIQVYRTVSGTDPYANLSGFTIRGVSGNRILTTVDGARVIERFDGGNRDYVDLSMMKAVEIQRGPGSVLWGTDAMGGIVSYQTLDPDDLLQGRNIGGRASYGFDSLNTSHTQNAIFGVQLDPKAQFMLGYTHRTYNETRLRNARADGGDWGCNRVAIGCDRLNPLDATTHNVLGKLVLRPNADHQIKLTTEFFRSDTDINQLYDRGITSTSVMTGVTTINDGDYTRNQIQSRDRFAFEHDWDVNTAWLDNLKWRLSYSPQKRATSDNRWYKTVVGGATTQYNTLQDSTISQDITQADIQLTSSFKAASTEHQLTYGFQGDYTDTGYYRKNVSNNITAGTSSTTYGAGMNFGGAKTTRADVYLQDEIKLFNRYLTITPGFRYAYYEVDPSKANNYSVIPGSEPRKIDAKHFIPQLGMLLKLTQEYSVYARYAEGFKMPSAEELYVSYPMSATINMVPNPNLRPEKVKSYETGIRGQFTKGWFSFGAFYSDYTDFILGRQLMPGTTSDYGSLNLDKVKMWGLEASAEWQFARNWLLTSSASYQHGKQISGTSSTYVPFDGASPLSGVLGIKWEQPAWKLSTELFGTFSKGITRRSNSSYYSPGGYAVFDGHLNWQIDKTFRISASIYNILNHRYFEYSSSTVAAYPTGMTAAATRYTNPLELYTAPGRTISLSLHATF